MTRDIKGTRYKKVKARDGRGRYAGRVHLVFWCKDLELYTMKHWRFVCGKRQSPALDYYLDCVDINDEEPVTCRGCCKFAPDIVEKMDVIPSLEEFQ